MSRFDSRTLAEALTGPTDPILHDHPMEYRDMSCLSNDLMMWAGKARARDSDRIEIDLRTAEYLSDILRQHDVRMLDRTDIEPDEPPFALCEVTVQACIALAKDVARYTMFPDSEGAFKVCEKLQALLPDPRRKAMEEAIGAAMKKCRGMHFDDADVADIATAALGVK